MNMNLTKTMSCLSLFLCSAQAFADGEGAPAGKEGGMSQTLMMIGVALLFFYFILWRPEQKRRKAAEAQRNSMKVGDKVTAMGIIGTIARIQETSVIVKMYDDSKIEILKAAITDVQSSTDEKPEIINSSK